MKGPNLSGSAKGRYDWEWQKVRAAHLAREPLCRRCGFKGQMVDHVESVRTAPHRRLDPTNLMTLCWNCHNKATRAFDMAKRQPSASNVEGQHLDPRHPWSAGHGTEVRKDGHYANASHMKRRWARPRDRDD